MTKPALLALLFFPFLFLHGQDFMSDSAASQSIVRLIPPTEKWKEQLLRLEGVSGN